MTAQLLPPPSKFIYFYPRDSS